MFIDAIFTTAKRWKQTKFPSTDELIKKRWFIFTMEYYSIMKNNGIFSFARIWINLEDTMLTETSQTEKVNYCMLSTYMCNLKNKIHQ